MVEFGSRLKMLRKNHDMTQKHLAARIGVAKSVVSYYERGDRFPSAEVLIRIAKLFHVSTDYLLGIERKRSLDVSTLPTTQILALEKLIKTMET